MCGPVCESMGKMKRDSRSPGEEGAGRLIKELMKLRRMTHSHIHTAQHDMTLITAEIDLTLLKTVCGGGKRMRGGLSENTEAGIRERKHGVLHEFGRRLWKGAST